MRNTRNKERQMYFLCNLYAREIRNIIITVLLLYVVTKLSFTYIDTHIDTHIQIYLYTYINICVFVGSC